MEQSGEYRIAASREVVWSALNDPEVLARCIEGCQSMAKTAEDAFVAAVRAKVGPVSAVFHAELTLTDIEPGAAYTLNAQVQGGVAGFARGGARVELADDEGGTVLRYRVTANVGGKLAQVGSRLIDAAARKMADDFFGAFGLALAPAAAVGPGDGGGAASVSVSAGAAPEPGSAATGGEPAPRYAASPEWKIWLVIFGAMLIGYLLAS
ncbi:MAG: SRPBCC family protein [Gammaproteobacteria bacterium]